MNNMLDLETMSSAPNSAILSIGAVHFDHEHLSTHEFYSVIKPESAARFGSISADTMKWWIGQSEEARKVWNDPEAVDLNVALVRFTDWVKSFKPSTNAMMWANGPDFDCVILSNAYRKVGARQPWSFRNNRCFRTLKGFFHQDDINALYKKHDTGEGRHNALYDARLQAKMTMDMLARVGVS